MNNTTKLKILGGVAVLALLVSFTGAEVIDTGHRGVKTKFGKVIGQTLNEGIYFYNPFTTSIVEMDTRTQRYDDTTTTYTKDVQKADISYGMNINLNKTNVQEMYEGVGRDWYKKLVTPIVTGAIKTAIGRWDAVNLVENRDEARKQIYSLIEKNLNNKGITLTQFELTDISYEPKFELAVEAKVTAVQRAEESKNKTIQIEEEAKQKVISAKAEAESMRIRANALSQNKALVEYEAVQKWDGKLPQYMLGNSTPFIKVGN